MGAMLSEPITAKVVERASGVSWSAAACTMQGYRRTHEDAHVLVCSGSGGQHIGVFAVLDGHGGDKCARDGAVLLQERMCEIARRGTLSQAVAEKELQKAFIEVDNTLRESLPQEDSSGSTVVAAIVTESGPSEYTVQLAHAGDSRAVLCLAGGKLVCTDDHKPGREDETARIQAAGGTVEHGTLGSGPLRVDGALAVSRSIGDFRFKPPEMAPERCKVTAVPEVQTVVNCKPGDWLLLACDGVFDVMTNEECHEFVSKRLSDPKADGGMITSELLTHCLDKGSKDNCTACLVQFLPQGSGTESPATRELLQGTWRNASPDIQAKYAEFFAAEGFERHAAQVREAAPPAPAGGGGAGRGRGGPAGMADLEPSRLPPLLMHLLQEHRSNVMAGRGGGRGTVGPPSGAPPGGGAAGAGAAGRGNRSVLGSGGRGNPGI